MTRTYTRQGPIDTRVRQESDGRWLAVARRGSGQEGRTTTAYALGPAAAAQQAINELLVREQADAREGL